MLIAAAVAINAILFTILYNLANNLTKTVYILRRI